MKIIYSKQDYPANNEITADAVICASGYEERSTAFFKTYSIKSTLKYVVGFNNNISELSRQSNDKFYKENNFSFFISPPDNGIILNIILDEIISKIDSNEITIIIDYSSMSSIWYATIIDYFRYFESNKNIILLFNYSYAKFVPANKEPIINKTIGPLPGFCNISIPIKPTALILGLGYEKDKAFGLTEYLDAETIVFYASSQEENQEFTEEVITYNSELLSRINEDNIIQYPIFDLDQTQALLNRCCIDLELDYRIVLAPCGPKPFTLLCLIASLKLGDIDVWRISSTSHDHIYNRESNGIFSIFKCVFK